MNHYAKYLQRVRKTTNIIAVEDIQNSQGAILTKAGSKLDDKICEKIVNFKLLKPVEDSVTIEGQLDATTLLEDINACIKADPWLDEINQKLGNTDLLEHCCQTFSNFSVIQQKITVLKMMMPNMYEQSLLSAYFSVICMSIKKQSKSMVHQAFIAGLVHDIGLLHINQDIFTKKGGLDAAEWRQMQSHPVIGFEVFKRISSLPTPIKRAVLEHHESLDGSGYPRGISGDAISPLGQLISLLDNIIVIYRRKFKSIGRSLRDVMPIIQMSSHNYAPEAVSMAILLLKSASPSTIEPQKKVVVEAFSHYVQAFHHYTISQVNTLVDIDKKLGDKHKNKSLSKLQTTSRNIHDICVRSGISTTSREEWLRSMESQNLSQAYRDAEDMYLMLQEMLYQVNGYKRSVSVFCAANEKTEAAERLKEALDIIESIEQPAIPDSLKEHWLLSK